MGIRIETYSVLVSIALGAGLLVSLAVLKNAFRRRMARGAAPAATSPPRDPDRDDLDLAFASGKLDWDQYRVRRNLLREARHVAATARPRQSVPPRPVARQDQSERPAAYLRMLALGFAAVGMAALAVDVSPYDPFSARTLSWSPGVTILLVGMAAAVARGQSRQSN